MPSNSASFEYATDLLHGAERKLREAEVAADADAALVDCFRAVVTMLNDVTISVAELTDEIKQGISTM